MGHCRNTKADQSYCQGQNMQQIKLLKPVTLVTVLSTYARTHLGRCVSHPLYRLTRLQRQRCLASPGPCPQGNKVVTSLRQAQNLQIGFQGSQHPSCSGVILKWQLFFFFFFFYWGDQGVCATWVGGYFSVAVGHHPPNIPSHLLGSKQHIVKE